MALESHEDAYIFSSVNNHVHDDVNELHVHEDVNELRLSNASSGINKANQKHMSIVLRGDFNLSVGCKQWKLDFVVVWCMINM